MRSYFCGLFFVLVLGCATAGECTAQGRGRGTVKKSSSSGNPGTLSTTREVLRTDGLLLAAIWDADAVALRKIADESLQYTSYSGEMLNKEQWIKTLEKIVPGTASYQVSNTRILLEGNMAVVSGNLNIKFKEAYDNGAFREGSGQQQYTHIYQRKNNQWFFVFGQMTPVAKYLWKFRNQ